MGAPRVSVTVPTRNHRAFIAEALDSILEQDYPNVEILVADDASTDGTQAIVLEYAERFPRKIKVSLSKRRCGISLNANKAWHACEGTYVALMSGDDLMYPGKLRRQVELMERERDCVLCYHDLDVFLDQRGNTLYRWNDERYNRPLEGGVEKLIVHGTFAGACSVMVRRSAAPANGFDPRIPISSDWLFMIQTVASGGCIRFIGDTLGGHRRHDNNVTARVRDLSESFRTLDIVESEYPQLRPYVSKGRGRLYYAEAVSLLAEGRGPEARAMLARSMRSGWLTWRSVARYVLSFLPVALGGPQGDDGLRR